MNCCTNLSTNAYNVPYLQVSNVTVTDTAVDLALGFRRIPPMGYFTVRIATAIPEGTTGTLPVTLTLNGTSRALTYFSGVNTALSILDTGANNYVISDDKTAITNEVEAFGTMSQNALNSVPYHQKVVAACRKMMLELNPSLQKEAERDSEITHLKNEMEGVKSSIGELASLLRSAISRANTIGKE